MSAQHTPGPWEWDGKVWEYDAREEAPFLVQAPFADVKSKTILSGSIKCSLAANARLIAAAPELLEGLKEVAEIFGEDWLEKSTQRRLGDMARALIAKAEGK